MVGCGLVSQKPFQTALNYKKQKSLNFPVLLTKTITIANESNSNMKYINLNDKVQYSANTT